MNTELFIARKLHFADNEGKRMSRPAVHIATIGIAIGLAVMICAVAVVVGFKQEVSKQVVGFGSHIQITHYGAGQNYDSTPIVAGDSLMELLRTQPHITHVQRVATKAGIVKTDDDFEGIVLKGVDATFDTTFFATHLTKGTFPNFADSVPSNAILISKHLANLLKISTNDRLMIYFVGEPIRARRFTVSGIYETTFAEFDKLFALVDLRHVQKLNRWQNNEIGQMELLVDDFSQLDATEQRIFITALNYDNWLQTRSIKKVVPRVFEWLDMLDMNAWVILALMLAVAGFNMISGLLIIILERTNTIGILKALGTRNSAIRKIFLYQATFLIGKGMLWGNLIGCGIVLLQYFTHLIPLDATMYYVDFVPVSLSFDMWLLINVGTLLVTVSMLIVPSFLITKIRPATSIKFD